MIRTIEAIIDTKGNVHLSEPIKLYHLAVHW